jgi:hypothetical protein
VKTSWHWSIVFPVVVILLLPAFATAEGWGWNPFSSKKSGQSGFRATDADTDWQLARKRPQAQQTTWQKVSSGTSSAWKKTSSVLNPWHKEPQPAGRVTGAGHFQNSAARAPAKSSGSTWYKPTTWFSSQREPEPRPTSSIPGFLGQKRVPY